MSDRIRAAIDHLYRATDLGCDCMPRAEITATTHIEQRIGQAIAILEEEAFPKCRCDNCGNPLHLGDEAYRIEKGDITELVGQGKAGVLSWGTGDDSRSLLLCPRCYDNNWVIGDPDDV